MTDVDSKLQAWPLSGLVTRYETHSRAQPVLDNCADYRCSQEVEQVECVHVTRPFFFFSQRGCALRRQSDGARASQGNRSRVDFIDITLLIYAAVKGGGGGDLEWGEERRKSRGQTRCLAKYGRANGSRKRILILILHTQMALYSPSGSSFPALRRQKA